jgi:hypothetical protein
MSNEYKSIKGFHEIFLAAWSALDREITHPDQSDRWSSLTDEQVNEIVDLRDQLRERCISLQAQRTAAWLKTIK